MTEEPLAGGYVNSVVRVGDTVRRKAGPWTPTVQRLLAHVRARGVAWAPEPRGCDEHGREVLAFIPGEVPHAMPAWVWSESVLTDTAGALRRWHDATADFPREGAVWHFPAQEPDEVICHNDFAPYNCVFREGRLVGVIDYDFCAPGPRLRDLTYAAYRFVPLMPPESMVVPGLVGGVRSPFAEPEQRARLVRFLDAYEQGGAARCAFSPAAFRETLVARLGEVAAVAESICAGRADHPLAPNPAMYRAHARWLAEWLV